MTSQQDQKALRTRLEEVLGQEHAATLDDDAPAA